MRKPLIAGNWKMNGTRETCTALLEALRLEAPHFLSIEIAVFPPFVFLETTERLLQGSAVRWGGQDVSSHSSGAYTGEVAASMLAEYACRYVMIGHSERRANFHETDQEIAQKCLLVQKNGMTPILCLGETLAQRNAGETLSVVRRQLQAVMSNQITIERLIIAYEPIWAIGTGLTPKPEQAQAVHMVLRDCIAQINPLAAQAIKILYGGSVKADNAKALLAMPDIDGALVGGASIKASEFLAICRAATL